jgi:hypothetical protein
VEKLGLGHDQVRVTGLSSYTLSSSAIGVEQIMLDNSNVDGGQTTWIMWAAIAPDYANAAGLTSVPRHLDRGESERRG